MTIKEQVVVITGGTKGLGLALKSSFLNRKNRVVVADRSVNNKGKKQLRDNILFIKADVTREADVKKLTGAVIKKFDKIDIWINNAGIWIPHMPIEKMNMKKVNDLMKVNLFGTIYGSKYALRVMKKQKKGIIINVLSSSALDGGSGSSGYCASKFAASGFTKCLRLETVNDNIKVISVYPRGMKTHLFDKKKPKNYDYFMDPAYVAEKIITNLESNNPKEDLIIKK